MDSLSHALPVGGWEFKGDEDDDAPAEIVTKALDTFKTTVDDRLKEIETKSDTSKLVARLDAVETQLARPNIAREDKSGEQVTEERKAFRVYLNRGDRASDVEKKAMVEAIDTQGGYMAPAETSTEFLRNLVEFSPIRSIASVRSIAAPSVKYPKRTGITNAQWEGEAEDSEESTIALGQVEVPARKLMTYVDLSNELLADSDGAAEREVRLALAEDFGQKEGAAFVNGDGFKQPQGLMTHPGIPSLPNGHATNLSADSLVDLMYSLQSAFRGRATWLMSDTTLAKIRKLKDGQGNFLWQPAFTASQPETILGRPVVTAVDMPDALANNSPIMFGDFSGYRIVDRLALSILVNPYLLATKGLTRMHATRRVGGKVIQPTAFRKLKMSVS